MMNRQRKNRVQHTMSKKYPGKTDYGIAKDILEVMTELIKIDHNASFEKYSSLSSYDEVVFTWHTEEEI